MDGIGAALAVQKEEQGKERLAALPVGQKTSLSLAQQNATDLLLNSKLSPHIKRGKEKLFSFFLH